MPAFLQRAQGTPPSHLTWSWLHRLHAFTVGFLEVCDFGGDGDRSRSRLEPNGGEGQSMTKDRKSELTFGGLSSWQQCFPFNRLIGACGRATSHPRTDGACRVSSTEHVIAFRKRPRGHLNQKSAASELVAMHSVGARASTLYTFAGYYLFFLLILNAISGFFFNPTPTASVSLRKVTQL